MGVDRDTVAAILAAVPQQPPFRFIDDILDVDGERIVGTYRFREDEYFYRGHFPGRPVTPGVILLETLAQTGVVAFGLYLFMRQGGRGGQTLGDRVTLFTFADNVEFSGVVRPGERVVVKGEKIYFRRLALKTQAVMERENGEAVCSAVLAGMAV